MYEAFVVALSVFVGVAGHELLGMAMLSRPIVVAPLVGLLLGDFQTGLIIGASLETIFMGVVNVGISSSAEPSLAAGLAAAFAIKMGSNADAAIPLAYPIAILGLQLMNMIFSFVCGPIAPKFVQLAKEGKDKEITRLHYGLWFLHYGLYALIPFSAMLFGSAVVESILKNIPGVIMNGLSVAGNLLPAVGMAMLLKMLWSKEVGIFFFVGVVCIAYLKLPLIAVAVIAAIIALVNAQRDMQVNKSKLAISNVGHNTEVIDEEEEFFN
ncbi:phosphotransferase system PTS sorbose-specific IIC subunit [Clostridium sp. DL-VIII]|uniref:PTS sugar transporter subunit IIC n=1 Tax=Clostridium sp. DL-VIII TaxID=641107 RepID=UPI00023B0850|nr:PTS sugar transporter subunit IIC [Clostridium sp. DL-VIII]EHJ01694.1 phosphotransferase system PTS sorbose-specific IIC subunit [Clostridium sp. DL-VIII]